MQSGASLLQELTEGATRVPAGVSGGSQEAKGDTMGEVLPLVVIEVVATLIEIRTTIKQIRIW